MPKQSTSKQLPNAKPEWYVLHTYSGYEDTVARNLRQRIESLGMKDYIFSVMVPTEKKIKIQGGKKKVVEEKVYPGYVLVQMIVTDESWYVVRNTPRVTGFVGAGNIPIAVDPEKIIQLEKVTNEEPEYKIEFKSGDSVKIKAGPFRDFNGRVAEIDEKRGRVKVLVDMFGRETPLELSYFEVQKI